LQKIEDKNFVKNSFEFKSTNETFVSKVIDKFSVKKATGVDKISVKLMKMSCGKQSNAFDKSIKIATIYSLQSKACFQSSKSLKIVV
jgi:hypothetical protein